MNFFNTSCKYISSKRVKLFKVTLLCLFFLNSSYIFGEIVEEIYYLIDNKPITKTDFEEELSLAKKNPESSFDFDISDKKQFMSNLIIEKLIENKLFEKNIAIKDIEVSNYINIIIKKNNIGNLENFIRILANSQDLSYKEYYQIIRKKLAFQNYVTRVLSTPPIQNREVEEYYQKNREKQFKVEDPIFNLSVLTLKLPPSAGFSKKIQVQNQLTGIKQEIIDKKILFEEAIQLYSEDETTKNIQGNIGWVDLNTLGISPENIKELNQLVKNQISELMITPNGLSIFKVNDVIKEGYIPYEVAINKAKNIIFSRKREKAFFDSLAELVSSSNLVTRKPELRINFNFN